MNNLKTKKIILIGNKGQLGKEFENYFLKNDFEFIAFDIDECDISDYKSIKEIFNYFPDIIINCAAYNFVDLAETDYETAFKVNSNAPGYLAELCEMNNAMLIHFSSDYIFNGQTTICYKEHDTPEPINKYGLSKLNGEKAISNIFENFLIFRLSWVYGNGTQNFIYKYLDLTKKTKELYISYDEISIPTSTQFIVEQVISSYNIGLKGIFHLTPLDYCSRFEWVNQINKILNLDVKINKVTKEFFKLPALRPDFSALNSSHLSQSIGINFENWIYYLEKFLKSNKI